MQRNSYQKRIDKRIERLYYQRAAGIEINIMDIPKVFKAGYDAIAANLEISDTDLGDAIAAYVETIRHN